MKALLLDRPPGTPLRVLCLGAHSDDLEIGCGGTMLWLGRRYAPLSVDWVVLGADDAVRRAEAEAGAGAILAGAAERHVRIERFRDGFFPFVGAEIKEYFAALARDVTPDLVLTHQRHDLHQDHRLVAELTWQTFRGALVLEYEIPKWDGDLGAPSVYVPLPEDVVEAKIRILTATFASQRTKQWFDPETFRGLLRIRGVEAGAQYAEAFYGRKLVVA
jgi:LmbE family N-acetylglucosaminyl deacetylase